MKTILRKLFAPAIFCVALLLVAAGCAHHSPAKAQPVVDTTHWRAGMAEVDITPPIGFRMAGYFDERLSTGTHDPLMAKAIVLQQGEKKIALVFCDLVGLSLHVTKPARARASRLTGIPVTNIMIAATHSHTGPLFDDVRRDDFHREAIARFGHDPQEKIDYPDFLTKQLVKVISEAVTNLQPSDIGVAIGKREGLAFNRRYYMKNGKVTFNPGQLNPKIVGPAGPVDPDVGILMVKNSKNGEMVGGLTVFAMHADTTGGPEFSADYPYGIQQTLRGAFGSNYISAFGAGTCGDINQVNVTKKEPFKGFDVARSLGDRLGQTVLDSLPSLNPITQPDLGVKSVTLHLPLQTVTPREIAEARVMMDRMRDTNVNFYLKVRAVKVLDLAEKGTNWPMEIQVFRLDKSTAIVCLPAEIFVQFGLAIKKASPYKNTLVIALCNDRPSYVPTLKAFQEGSYEVSNSRVKAGDGEIMVETAIKLLNELKREE